MNEVKKQKYRPNNQSSTKIVPLPPQKHHTPLPT